MSLHFPSRLYCRILRSLSLCNALATEWTRSLQAHPPSRSLALHPPSARRCALHVGLETELEVQEVRHTELCMAGRHAATATPIAQARCLTASVRRWRAICAGASNPSRVRGVGVGRPSQNFLCWDGIFTGLTAQRVSPLNLRHVHAASVVVV
ncbi:hypothetical protein DFH06DRAFT_1342787 [Mycena polygramma]|nr:hypothetical protein DFH06DRAFT_1342787 [Mycena polygramma]